ncbi:hypothetical protein EVAR_74557_1 [Eumeta japonica]|uniref:Uncharacterized protein n=1 Tax=Eumeta variegata TaxID=151549 RepID=A0A4C1TBM6_EUMVA|nr:hypothetical protein EVAR_74557_1 [Eumeta japonica]
MREHCVPPEQTLAPVAAERPRGGALIVLFNALHNYLWRLSILEDEMRTKHHCPLYETRKDANTSALSCGETTTETLTDMDIRAKGDSNSVADQKCDIKKVSKEVAQRAVSQAVSAQAKVEEVPKISDKIQSTDHSLEREKQLCRNAPPNQGRSF